MSLIKSCICGNSSDFSKEILHQISVKICNNCNIIHQDLNMSKEEYFNFYANDYHEHYQSDRGTDSYPIRYNHDKEIAALRIKQYQPFLRKTARTLDIGSSNNAFVDLMNEHGYNSYGLEISTAATKYIKTYNSNLFNVNFPAGYFDMITLHDVFEHLIDPISYLTEIHKLLKGGGVLIIDFPAFFIDAGKHHWKRIEHLWFLTDEQIQNIAVKYGFNVNKVNIPIPSKIVYYLTKKSNPNKKKLLFMPGMGDIYWGLTKAKSFIEINKLGNVESYIWDIDKRHIGNKQRSEGFLDRISFMEYKGTVDIGTTSDFKYFYTHKHEFMTTGMYSNTIPWYKENVNGCHYFFNFNGLLEVGESIDSNRHYLGQYKTDWYPKMFTPIEEIKYELEYKREFGRYIFRYFTGVGNYDNTFNLPLGNALYNMLYEIYKKTGAKIVITGTTWDAQAAQRLLCNDTHHILIDMVNKTDTSKMFALMKGSIGVIGWPAGNTIMSTYFKIPTIIIWSNKLWHRNFPTNCIVPEALNKWYFPFFIENFIAKNIIDTAANNFK